MVRFCILVWVGGWWVGEVVFVDVVVGYEYEGEPRESWGREKLKREKNAIGCATLRSLRSVTLSDHAIAINV